MGHWLIGAPKLYGAKHDWRFRSTVRATQTTLLSIRFVLVQEVSHYVFCARTQSLTSLYYAETGAKRSEGSPSNEDYDASPCEGEASPRLRRSPFFNRYVARLARDRRRPSEPDPDDISATNDSTRIPLRLPRS